MSTIRLLAIDVDGTLVEGEDEIRPRTREALHRAHEAGVQLAFATGRRYRRTRSVAARLGLPVPAVCLGGALVKAEDGRTVRANAFSPEALRAVAALLREHGHTAIGQRDGEAEGSPDFVIDGSLPWNGWSRRYWERNREYAEWLPRLSDEERDDVLVVGSFGERRELEELAGSLHRSHPGSFTSVVMQAFRGEGYYCEIVPSHVSKWEGLRQLADHAGVAHQAICAVGDERNDLSMIRGAALGVAMGNAPPEVQAAADWVTGRLEEDGLAGVVDRILDGG